MSDIARYLEVQELVKKANLDLEYKQGGIFVISGEFYRKRSALEPRGACIPNCKVLISTKNIDIAYGAITGYLFAKENM